jgi:hypothetical protein
MSALHTRLEILAARSGTGANRAHQTALRHGIEFAELLGLDAAALVATLEANVAAMAEGLAPPRAAIVPVGEPFAEVHSGQRTTPTAIDDKGSWSGT